MLARGKIWDGRVWQARLLTKVRRDLTAHVGDNPSATQRALIERCAWLSLYVAQIDRRTAAGREMTDHDARSYLAWSNSLGRSLVQLGTAPTRARAPTLADHLADKAGVAA